jgi:SPP1 gp7 family putative phage head morphogenesis protein
LGVGGHYFGALHNRLHFIYDCNCADCKGIASLSLAMTNKGFKNLLKTAEKAFKKLHENAKYHPKDLKNTLEYQNLINETNDVFDKTIVDNVVDGALLENLQNDVFLFSGLKTHAQLFEASRLLLNSENKIKPFSEFYKDVKKINETYNRQYLEAEYQFAVASSQTANKWADFSDDYNLQYRTAGDQRVRDSHDKLRDTTLPKSDPFWDSFMPPNGWRCRCTVVEVLPEDYKVSDSKKAIEQGNLATSQIGKDGKNKLAIFRFNPGKDKVIFPPSHPYSKVAGANVVKKELSIENKQDRYKDINFKKLDGIKNNGVLEKFTTGKQNSQEAKKNEKALKIIANNGGQYRLLPVIEDGNKNPDAMNIKTKQLVDIKVSETTNGKNIIQSALKEANKQGVKEVIIHLTKKPDSYRIMYGAVLNTFNQKRAKNIRIVTVIYPNNIVKSYNTDRFKKKKV